MQTVSTQSIPDEHNVEKVGLRRLAEIIRNNLAYWVKPDGRTAIARACTELEQVEDGTKSATIEPATKTLHLLFDGMPGPEGPRFIESEDESGHSVRAGEWKEREDGNAELVITVPASTE